MYALLEAVASCTTTAAATAAGIVCDTSCADTAAGTDAAAATVEAVACCMCHVSMPFDSWSSAADASRSCCGSAAAGVDQMLLLQQLASACRR
jgi:hypothetical protein